MKTGLSEEEKHAFPEMVFALNSLKGEYSLEEIRAKPMAGVNKDRIGEYITSYVKNGYCELNESTQKIMITKKGVHFFEQLRSSAERKMDKTKYVRGMGVN